MGRDGKAAELSIRLVVSKSAPDHAVDDVRMLKV
jgi:hypothetical protein